MPDINCSDLQTELVTELTAVTGASCSKDILLLADAHERISVDHCNSIDCIDNLPNIDTCSFPPGQIVYSSDLGCLVVSGERGWYDMDAALVRQDLPIDSAWGFGGGLGENEISVLDSLETNGLSSPVSMRGGYQDWCKICHFDSGYGQRGVAITKDNRAFFWGGCFDYYRATDASGVNPFTPVELFTQTLSGTPYCQWQNGVKTWTDVTFGTYHTALLGSGCVFVASTDTCFCNWGPQLDPFYHQPAYNITNVTKIAAGENSLFALKTNKTILSWGYNAYGVLGDNGTIDQYVNMSSPVTVAGGFTDWCFVAAAQSHAAAIRENGTLWMWGYGGSGQLGNNSSNNFSSPVSVVGGFTDWCTVSTTREMTAAIRENGTLWTWGTTSDGGLGNNETSQAVSSPVSVVGGFTDWCAVSTATFAPNLGRAAAIRTNGTLWAWGTAYGSYGYGTLGDNSIISRSSPVEVTGGFCDWTNVSTGAGSIFGIRSIL